MISELFSIGPLSISPFGVLLVLGFLGAFLQLRWGLRLQAIGTEDDPYSLLVAAALGGIVGGKVYYAILYQDWKLLISRAGLVFYGGLIGGAIAVLFLLWRSRSLPFWKAADALSLSLIAGYGIGRIGCFLVGDDYGVPSDLPWAVAFPEGPIPTEAGAMRRNFDVDIPPDIPGSELLTVHPTQIYESLAALVILLVGRKMLRSKATPGIVLLFSLSLLAIERFLVEFVRAKDDRLLGDFTLAQGISVGLVLMLIAVGLATRTSRQQARETG